MVAELAGGIARLELIDGAGHAFDAEAERVHHLVAGWWLDQLSRLVTRCRPRVGSGPAVLPA